MKRYNQQVSSKNNSYKNFIARRSKHFAITLIISVFLSISSGAQAPCTPAGDPLSFGNDVWKVYAWNAGGNLITPDAWHTNYSGYYVDTNLNFNTELGWDQYGSPSDVNGYSGCPVSPDNHSWSAKRWGFPCGLYQISLGTHYGAIELYLNGDLIIRSDDMGAGYFNAWSGSLGPTDKIEFRGTAGSFPLSKASLVLLPLSLVIEGDSTICRGDSSLLLVTPHPGATYNWSTGETTSGIFVPGTADKNISVIVSYPNGCSFTDNKNITVLNSPLFANNNIVDYVASCPQTSATINVTGAGGYTWAPSTGLNTTTGATVIANPATSTIYTVTSTDPGGCSSKITVDLVPPVSIKANGPVVFCEGDSVLLSAKPDAGNAFVLNGVSNAVTTPDVRQYFPKSSVTIELWFKADRQGVILTELGPNQIGTIGINTGWHNSQIEILADNKVKVRVWDLPAVELGTASFSAWHHVVLRYNAATQTLDGFLDNVRSAASVQGIRSLPSALRYSFGATDNQNLGSGEYFSGQMDDIRIWNVARTDAQIQNNSKLPIPENSPGLVAYYKFDESADFTAKDATLNALDGSIWNLSFTVPTPARQASTIPLDYSNYLWSTGATSPDIWASATGGYTVNVTAAGGCLSTASKQVTVKQKPVPVGDSIVNICLGDSVNLRITGNGDFTWSPATGLSATTGLSVMASPAENTIYTITSTDTGLCSTQIRVNVKPVPGPVSITPNGPTSFCYGDSVILTASGADNYLWNTGATTTGITVKQGGTYTVTTANENGCTASASIDITVGVPPQVVGKDTVIVCAGASATLAVTGVENCTWSPSVYLDQSTGLGVTVTPATSQTYTITNNDGPACSSKIVVIVKQLPVPVINTTINNGMAGYCPGDSATLTTGEFASYSWSDGKTGRTIRVAEATNYSVTVTDADGCTGTGESLTIHAFTAPSVTLIGDSVICKGGSTFLVAGGVGASFFSWSDGYTGGAGYSVSPAATTTYTVYGSNYFGCYDTASFTVQVRAEITYYQDNDGDGYGNPAISMRSCVPVEGWVTNNGDCADNYPTIHPGAEEICDGYDNDCDGLVDEDTPAVDYYSDLDGDGYGGSFVIHTKPCFAAPGLVTRAGDCNDNDASIHPGAAEICDGIDNDCDGLIDEGFPETTYYKDNDGDGYGNNSVTIKAKCGVVPTGYVTNNTDCNDNNASIHPGATELCDGIDNDCDGLIDEGFPLITYYQDGDGDGYGNSAVTLTAKCNAPAGYVSNNTDCNDKDATIHAPRLYYYDNDHDGYGSNESVMLCSSTAPFGYSENNYDCDDKNFLVPQVVYRDADGDGFGAGDPVYNCEKSPPAGYSTNNFDCNDNDATITTPHTYYLDADGDGFGSTPQVFCLSSPPPGYSAVDGDCNDKDPAIGAAVGYYPDLDGDGFGAGKPVMICSPDLPPAGYVTNGLDCDDSRITYEDNDKDGFGSTIKSPCGVNNNTDCNDNDPSKFPVMYYRDNDRDGFGDPQTGILVCGTAPPAGYVTNGLDCNDANAQLTTTIRYYRDNDGDGFGDASSFTDECSTKPPPGYVTNDTDCNDNDPAMGPPVTFYFDMDGDGFGNPSMPYRICSNIAPPGYANNNLDCDDANPFITAPKKYYADTDHDGFGDPNNFITDCSNTPPPGYVTNNQDCNDTKILYTDSDNDGYGSGLPVACGVANNTDCNDNDNTVYPGAPELCDGKDNNCNGTIDEGLTLTTYYRDADGDGYGNAAITITAKCVAPAGYVTDKTDCNDNDAGVHEPVRYYPDADKDGYGVASNKSVLLCTSIVPAGYSIYNTDCNDKNAAIYPGAPEICDGIDNNCDGQIDEGCPQVTISINDASIVEGNNGKGTLTFSVTLSQASTKAVTVNYTTVNGTATAPSDYATKSGSLTFKAGTTSQQVAISITGDKTIEPDEIFTVVLSSPTNAVISKGTGTGTIINDDGNVLTKSTPGTNRELETTAKDETNVRLWPNPTSDLVNLQLNGYTGLVTIKLSTLDGKLVQHHQVQPAIAGYNFKMNLAGYSAGTYVVTVTDAKGKVYTGKLIVAR